MSVVLCLACALAESQSLLAVATGISSAREAARVYLVCVDFDDGGSVSSIYALPGAEANSPLLLRDDALGAVLSTQTSGKMAGLPPSGVQSYLSEFDLQDPDSPPISSVATPPAWRGWAGCLLSVPMGHTMTALLRESYEGGESGGVMEAIPWAQAGGASSAGRIRWRLSGTPVAACPLPSQADAGPRLAVLCRSTVSDGSCLFFGDVSEDAPRPQELQLSNEAEGLHGTPAALAVDPKNKRLFVLTTGFDWESSSGDAVTWLHLLDPETLQATAPALALRGSPVTSGTPLFLGGDGRCWIATQLPEPDLIQFSGIQVQSLTTEGCLEITAQYAVQGSGPVHWVAEPNGIGLAIAVERNLEIWSAGVRGGIRTSLANPVGALFWNSEGLFVGEAGQIHRLDAASGKILQSLQIQQGFIAALAGLPPGTNLATTKAEAAWPAPLIFHAEAAGREIRGWPIPEGSDPESFRAEFDPAEMPWLEVIREQRAGRRSAFYFFVKAVYGAPGEPLQGHVHMVRERAPGTPPLSVEVPVRVISSSDPVRRLLWLRSGEAANSLRADGEAAGFRTLAAMLAGPPFFFAHEECNGPFQSSLTPYTIVVVDAEAAARGWVTRRAVLDYVSSGGALLFIGKNLGTVEDEALRAWLAPLQIRLDMHTRVSGVFSPSSPSPLTESWKDFNVENGGLIVGPTESILVARGEEPKEGVFAATSHGYGRVALLSAATPLENARLASESNRAFASTLFSWLSRARSEYADLDSDRLPDGIEDRNNNGQVDPGETDYLRPDSDGDGLPDGVEDANLNGIVDDAETDPRNPDSDGDGVFDGADPTPCPSHGQLYLAAAVPPQAPAEGGRPITILGRNFSPDTRFWVGGQAAKVLQWLDPSSVVVRLPQTTTEAGRAVDIRAEAATNHAEATLPQGFLYLPRSRAALRLVPVETPVVQQGQCKGRLGVDVTLPPEVQVRQISILIEAAPPGGFLWGDAETPAHTPSLRVQGRARRGGRFLVVLDSGALGLPTGRLLTLPYSFPAGNETDIGRAVTGIRATSITRDNTLLDTEFSIGTLPLSTEKASVR